MRKAEHKGTKHLYEKIGGLILLVLIAVFAVLITVSLFFTRKAVLNATYNDLMTNSKANGCQIQEFMNICQSTAKNLTSHIEELLGQQDALSEPDGDTKDKSVVYKDLSLNKIQKQLEEYLIATAENAVAHNDSIIGIGIMFDPFQFTADRRSYALYFTNEGDKVGVSDVGDFDEFSANEYFQIAVDKKDTVFTKPYTYRDMWMITGATPIIVNNVRIGVINVDISMSEFDKLGLHNDNYPSMNIIVTSADGTIAFDSSHGDNIGKNMADVTFKNEKDADRVIQKFTSTKQFQESYQNKDSVRTSGFFYPLSAGSETWQTVTNVSKADMERASVMITIVLAVCSAIALMIIVAVASAALKKSLSPIGKIVTAADHIAKGNLDIRLDVSEDTVEMKQLSHAFQTIVDKLTSIINDENRMLGQMAKGNFCAGTLVEKDYVGAFEPILISIQNINKSLSAALKQIDESADMVAGGSGQVAESSKVLSESAAGQTNSIEELACAITEISDQITRNEEDAAGASSKAALLGQEILSCNEMMKQLIEAMAKINESSNAIAKITETVEDIAFQTNILALNAAVEAARAGEAGKSFAIVADQIRDLANKSKEAAQDTTNLIRESMTAVDSGTTLAGKASESLNKVVIGAEDVTATVSRITEASHKQADWVKRVSIESDQIREMVETNSASAREGALTSEELSEQAKNLKELVQGFQWKE